MGLTVLESYFVPSAGCGAMALPSDAGFRRALADSLAGFAVLLFALVLEVAGVVFASTFGPGLAFIGLIVALAGVAMIGFAVHVMGPFPNPPPP